MENANILFSFAWFLGGAVTALALRNLVFFNEQRKIFTSLVTPYVSLIASFKQHLIVGLEKKREWYKEEGLSDSEVANQTLEEHRFIEAWELVATAIFVGSVPKKYQKYLQTGITKQKDIK